MTDDTTDDTTGMADVTDAMDVTDMTATDMTATDVTGAGATGATADAGDTSRTTDARMLTEAVTRLRRALRVSIRTDYPWEQLPMAQVELLQVLAERSPARVSDLAARRHLAASTVSGLIGQMTTAGLVARTTDPDDRRASAVTLTDRGRAQLDAWTEAHERRLDAALATLDEDERAAVRTALPALFRLAERLGDVAD